MLATYLLAINHTFGRVNVRHLVISKRLPPQAPLLQVHGSGAKSWALCGGYGDDVVVADVIPPSRSRICLR